MHDLPAILGAYQRLCARGETGVLASVLHVEGSTYRRPGARALIDASGAAVGLVSGGCLEGDLALRAVEVRESGRPKTLRYDSRDDADLLFGLGLGCRGVVDVALEVVDAEHPGPLAFLEGCFRERRAGVLVTEPGADAMRRWTLTRQEGVEVFGALPQQAGEPPPAVRELARSVLRGRRARTAPEMPGAGARYAEYVPPRLRLLVIGAGPDAPPLVALAAELGWQVLVWDARDSFADPARLPGADGVRCREPSEGDPEGVVDAETAVVVMNHHFERDRAALRWLLASPARYIAALGPRERTHEMLAELGVEPETPGRDTPPGLAVLHAPAGLDIGAETAQEIALSITAEIQSVLAGHPGGPLALRKGPIHERSGA